MYSVNHQTDRWGTVRFCPILPHYTTNQFSLNMNMNILYHQDHQSNQFGNLLEISPIYSIILIRSMHPILEGN